jgi:hypothetical protein
MQSRAAACPAAKSGCAAADTVDHNAFRLTFTLPFAVIARLDRAIQ